MTDTITQAPANTTAPIPVPVQRTLPPHPAAIAAVQDDAIPVAPAPPKLTPQQQALINDTVIILGIASESLGQMLVQKGIPMRNLMGKPQAEIANILITGYLEGVKEHIEQMAKVQEAQAAQQRGEATTTISELIDGTTAAPVTIVSEPTNTPGTTQAT